MEKLIKKIIVIVSILFCSITTVYAVNDYQCDEGEYQNVLNNGAWQCSDCPRGYTSDPGATSINQCYVNIVPGKYISSRDKRVYSCAKGTYSNVSEKVYYGDIGTSKCNKCPLNTYSDNEGSSQCKPCLSGTRTDGIGATSSSACKRIEVDSHEESITQVNGSCQNFQFIINIVEYLIILLKWIIPILLIIFIVFDITKTMINIDKNANGDSKKLLLSRVTKRFIYAIIIFLIPTIVKLLFNYIDKYSPDGYGNDNSSMTWIKCVSRILNG